MAVGFCTLFGDKMNKIDRSGIVLKTGDFFIVESKSRRFRSSFLVTSSNGEFAEVQEDTYDSLLDRRIQQGDGGAAHLAKWNIDERAANTEDPLMLVLFIPSV
jgi:hypothetical protein